MKKYVYFSCILFFLNSFVKAQKTDFYGNAQAVCSDVVTSNYDTEVKSYIQILLSKAGRTNDEYIISACKTTSNCEATFLYGKPYILFNPEFWGSIRGFNFAVKDLPKNDVNWVAMTILAHELGHIVNRHFEDKTKTNKQLELEADNYAGFLMYQMGATLSQAQQAMYHPAVNVADLNDSYSTHPAREQRLEAIKMGYSGAKSINEINPNVALKIGEVEYREALKYYYGNDGRAINYNKAFLLFEKSASLGFLEAKRELGNAYYTGIGVQQSNQEAYKWYKISADEGDILGQCNLGTMLFLGRGINKNKVEAFKWFTKAATAGLDLAQYQLGVMYQNNLTPDYLGERENLNKAHEWYTKSAKQGFAIAQHNLGVLYEKGIGVNKNDEEAIKWYTKSAEQGDRTDQTLVGQYYLYKEETDLNSNQMAYYWLLKASQQGDDFAMFLLGNLYRYNLWDYYYKENIVVDWSYFDLKSKEDILDKGIFWYNKSIELNNENGAFELYLLYNRQGKKDDARKYLTKAAELGNNKAIEELKKLQQK